MISISVMKKTIEKYLWKLLRKADPAYHSAKTSWSQLGEDMIIDFIFTWQLGCPLPSYLDIGANHPSSLSNTYFFYKKGCRGVNIEPDPVMLQQIAKKRNKDINLNIGVASQAGELDFYKMSQSTLSTFSKSTAEEYSKLSQYNYPAIVEVVKIKVLSINDILEAHFSKNENYFISIDVEGLDLEIVASIDFSKYTPPVICVETATLNEKGELHKAQDITNLLISKGYFVYADTLVNSIFVRKGLMK